MPRKEKSYFVLKKENKMWKKLSSIFKVVGKVFQVYKVVRKLFEKKGDSQNGDGQN